MKRILIGSPICKKPSILKVFLDTVVKQKRDNIEIDYYFVDDNQESESSDLLNMFAKNNENCSLVKMTEKEVKYDDNNYTHNWNEYLIWRVAFIKNSIIKYAIENKYDYLFFVDSDLVLNPSTIQHLISLDLDIVSEVFWTQWKPNEIELPQVWISDEYNLAKKNRGEILSQQEESNRAIEFIKMLREPGVYEVGGLGACTLISRNALLQGANFSMIKNLSYWGEDRHFCIRANAIGLDLFADTKYPPLHIYRDDDLKKVEEFCVNNGLK